ncbi:MAG: hypothetical protein HYX92_18135 [Chloroflexi bacterium]|nr:hypothetical protein [Chloroflexota bacterium]
MTLKSRSYDVADAWEFLELAYKNRWTDGLPVAPPTEERIQAMIEYTGLPGDRMIGEVPPRNGAATIEKIAINCVMAGCLPEYMPVVIAAVEAMIDPAHNLQGVQTTTHSCEPLLIVSGPIVQELGFATQEAVFGGGGGRPNATIGRAIRLILWNIGGGYPGEPCKESIGHPGRYCFCIPEDNEFSPWEPLHVERGLPEGSSGVTVFACESPHSANALFGTDMTPTMILDTVADTMSALGNNNTHTMGQTLVVLAPNVARHLAGRGWSKLDIKKYLFDKARRPISALRPRSTRRPGTDPEYWYDWWPKWVDQSKEQTLVPVVADPQDIHIVVTGQRSARWMGICPGWGEFGGYAVSKPVG